MKPTPPKDSTPSVDALNSLLRGELAAVEAYEQVLQKFADDALPTLEENCEDHRRRVPLLTSRIQQLGGSHVVSSGAWGVLTSAIEAGAQLFGKDMAFEALESGEDTGLDDYRKVLNELDPESQNLVRRELLPAQERSHLRMSQLKHTHAV